MATTFITNPFQFGTAFTGAYDDIPDLIHLYEMARRGVSSYEGNLVRLRRNSDNAELDFGYDENGDLDTAAIATWIGGSSANIVTLYDQIGGNDVTQGTSGDQPVYVASGQNSKPVMRYDAANHYLQGAWSAALTQPYTYYSAAISNDNDDGAARNITYGDDGSNRTLVGKLGTGSPDNWRLFAGSTLTLAASDTNFNVWASLFNGASSESWTNGNSIGTGNAGTTENADGLTIGASRTGTQVWDGDIAMVAVADPSHDDTERGDMQTAINDYWGAY